MDMPQAMRKKKPTPNEATLKPCARPYQGTSTAAPSVVKANIRVVTQLIGGSAAGAGCDMVLISVIFS